MSAFLDTVFWWVGAVACSLGALCGLLAAFWWVADFIVSKTESMPVLFEYAVHRKRFREWRDTEKEKKT